MQTDVLHDFHGLIDLMGGLKASEAKLDENFTQQISSPKFDFGAWVTDSTTPLSPTAGAWKWKWTTSRTANSELPIRRHPT